MFPSGLNSGLTDLFCDDGSYWLGRSATQATHQSVLELMQLDPNVLEPNTVHLEIANLKIASRSNADHEPDPPSIHALLQLAQQQLQVSHIPAAIKIALYLKICCLAIQKSFVAEQPIPAERLYHNLMQWLGECEPEWWQQCSITAKGLTSHNARIRDLLQPLTDFVQRFLEG